MGASAVPLARSNCKNTVSYVKRVFGRKFADPALEVEKKFIPIESQLTEAPNGSVGIQLRYGSNNMVFSTESVAAMMLKKLQKTIAVANNGRSGGDVVVTVPGYWTDAQRRGILNACDIAQVKCVGLVNENTATALNYGIWKNVKGEFTEEKIYVLFVDVGYSAYSVSLVAFQKGKLEVIATEFDQNLGGRNIDMMLAQRFAAEFQKKHNVDVFADPKAMIKLMLAVEKTKITLTPIGVPSANCNIECLKGDYDLNSRISIDEFNELCEPLCDRLEGPIQKVLSRAGLSSAQLASVEVVGGSSRVACFKRKLSSICGLDADKLNFGLSMTMNADESVAMGAALACASLSPLMAVKPFEVVDSVYYPIRLSWDPAPVAATDNDMEVDEVVGGADTLVLYNKGEGYPKTRRVTFRRADAFQITASYDAESTAAASLFQPDLEIAKFNVSAVPAEGQTDVPRIRVHVRQTLDGTLSITSAEYMVQKVEEPTEEAKTAPAPADAQATKEAETPAKEGEAAEEGEAPSTESQAPAPGEGEAPAKEEASAAPVPVEPAKKKFRRVNLPVACEFPEMNSSAKTEAIELEVTMTAKDQLIEETNDLRNELESFMYETRDSLNGWGPYCTEADRSSLSSQLDELENWLYDEGSYAEKPVLVEKLAGFRAITGRIETRRKAEEGRPAACQKLSHQIEQYRSFANTTDAKYEHISDEERQKVRDKCTETAGWLNEMQTQQGALNSYDDPVLTPEMIDGKLKSLNGTCRPVTRIPKPKPAPAPAPAEEAKPATEDPKPAAAEGEGASPAPAPAADGETPPAAPAADMDLD